MKTAQTWPTLGTKKDEIAKTGHLQASACHKRQHLVFLEHAPRIGMRTSLEGLSKRQVFVFLNCVSKPGGDRVWRGSQKDKVLSF